MTPDFTKSFPTGGLSVYEQCIEEFSNLVLVCINRHIGGILVGSREAKEFLI